MTNRTNTDGTNGPTITTPADATIQIITQGPFAGCHIGPTPDGRRRACFDERGRIVAYVSNHNHSPVFGPTVETFDGLPWFGEPMPLGAVVNCDSGRHTETVVEHGQTLLRITEPDGSVEWRWALNNKTHRLGAPARISASGCMQYFRSGRLHNDDGPAVIMPDGSKHWYHRDLQHRVDGPARIEADGRERYYLHGVEYDPAQAERPVVLAEDVQSQDVLAYYAGTYYVDGMEIDDPINLWWGDVDDRAVLFSAAVRQHMALRS